MKRLGWLVSGIIIVSIFRLDRVSAVTNSVLIAQAMPNGATATQEYVSIYNNSDTDIDITGWCVKYNGSSSKPGCITAPDTQTRLYLAAYTYTTFASADFMTSHSGFTPQARTAFTAGLADAGGTLTLVDSTGTTQDQFTWAKKLTPGTVYQRIQNEQDIMQDTDIDGIDFAAVPLTLPSTGQLGLYEYVLPVDVCDNLSGIQETVPEGYGQDEAGDCVQDVCPNLAGLQETLPVGYITDGGECMEAYHETAFIDITELLPNPTSYDTGLEFVELYNPNDRAVELAGYRLELGPSFTKVYTFPSQTIQPSSYTTLADSTLGFSLPNSDASMRLVNAAGEVVSETPSYGSAPEAESWALIGDAWEFTVIPTPDAANQPTPTEELATNDDSSLLSPCPTGKYRNPETNRCRNIGSSTGTLQPCAADEYRNASTNRCRKLTTLSSSSLTPCKPGQVRNPDTNRCRTATNASAKLKPCDTGYERSAYTNRCRKTTQVKAAQSADDAVSTRASNNILVGLMLTLTAGYAVYEYRYDVVNLYHRLRIARQKRQAGRLPQNTVS